MNRPENPPVRNFSGPHGQIETSDPREIFALELFDALWEEYRRRVSYAATYETVNREAGGTFVNDHIAFRTLALQTPFTGIASISRIFEALGYRPAGCYFFDDKHLNAIHFQHPHPLFPKLFISELKMWEMGETSRRIIRNALSGHREPVSDETLSSLVSTSDLNGADRTALMNEVVGRFHQLPWLPPEKRDVETLNGESQYAAWVLVHGYNVNHFTALINSHANTPLDDIEKTIAALSAAGVPMKESIEGERGSKLRQSATQAVFLDVPVRENGVPSRLSWTYAYFELAERGEVIDPATKRPVRFEGFLGPQATQLFEMTRKN